MERDFEQLKNLEEISQEKKEEFDKGKIIERLYKDVLASDSFEETANALDEVNALQNYREKIKAISFSNFYDVFEEATNINRLLISKEEKERKIKILAESLENQAQRFSPRVADLYIAVLSEIGGRPYEARFETTSVKVKELKDEGDLEVLLSGDTFWDLKFNRIEKRFLGYLNGVRAIDKREGNIMEDEVKKERQEQLKHSPTNPHERRRESKPSMDEMERLKEGERANAIWSIYPAYGGYFREQAFSKWNRAGNKWIEDEYEYSDVEFIPICDQEDTEQGKINFALKADIFAGRWINLPVPYTHSVHKVESGGRIFRIQQDQNGDIVILIEGEKNEEIEIIVTLAPQENKTYGPRSKEKIKVPEMPAEFSEETEKAIQDAKRKKGNTARAHFLASHTRYRLKYSNESKYNQIYDNFGKGYFAGIDEHRKADCDVANTYFAALCTKLNIPVRHCVGHSVRSKDSRGEASINSGTGHAWSEIWDDKELKWARIDATPAGDPNLEEEEKGGAEHIPGDYGEQEAVKPFDEQIEALRKKLEERKEELSYTNEERYLAEATGVELKEARKIMHEIDEAERTKLPNGELVVDALSRLFNAIVESRKAITPSYDGPVRKREGGEAIENIVVHKIGILVRDTDPLSREKPSEEIEEEKAIGGFDVYMIGDKSGSMSNTVEGEALWKMQRRAEYLIFSSLHRFSRNIERAGLQKENELSVRTQGISFRGSGEKDIDIDKALSKDFTSQDKVKLWKSLTTQGSANGDVAALSYVYEQIKNEIQSTEKKGGKDNKLRIVIACSDGGPDDAAMAQKLAEDIGRLNAVVVGLGLTETAATVPVIYNTPHSRGEIVREINDLPAVVAKHIVAEAIKLFPEKAKESSKRLIESSIAKFKKI